MNYVAFHGTHRMSAIVFSNILYFLRYRGNLESFKWRRIFFMTLVVQLEIFYKRDINLFITKKHYRGRYLDLNLLNLTYERRRQRKHKNTASHHSLSFILNLTVDKLTHPQPRQYRVN